MKKFLIAGLALLFVVNFADGRPPRAKKAGDIEDGVYTDNAYGFQVSIPEGWDGSVKKEDSYVRLVISKNEYEIPMQFQHAPAYTQVPKITVIADTTSWPLPIFVDSVMASEYDSDQKKDILEETPILFGDFQQKRKGQMVVGDLKGMMVTGRQQYTIQVQRAGSESDKADVVTDYKGGSVFFARNPDNNTLVVINFICEDRYYDHLEDEFEKILNTFKFVSKK